MQIPYNPDNDNPWGLDEAPPLTALEDNIEFARNWCRRVAKNSGFGDLTYAGEGGSCKVMSDPDKTFAYKIRPTKLPRNWNNETRMYCESDIRPDVFESMPWWHYPRGIGLTPYVVAQILPEDRNVKEVVFVFISAFMPSLLGRQLDDAKLQDFKGRLTDSGCDPVGSDIKPANLSEYKEHYYFIDGGAERLPVQHKDWAKIKYDPERTNEKRQIERAAYKEWEKARPPLSPRQQKAQYLLLQRQFEDIPNLRILRAGLHREVDDHRIRLTLMPRFC